MKLTTAQLAVCQRFGAAFAGIEMRQKIGISQNALRGLRPIHALRHNPEGDTCGWYIWAGEDINNDPDFFAPLHVEHLKNVLPEVVEYLGLAPGWRVLIDPPDYEDVWFDSQLLAT